MFLDDFDWIPCTLILVFWTSSWLNTTWFFRKTIFHWSTITILKAKINFTKKIMKKKIISESPLLLVWCHPHKNYVCLDVSNRTFLDLVGFPELKFCCRQIIWSDFLLCHCLSIDSSNIFQKGFYCMHLDNLQKGRGLTFWHLAKRFWFFGKKKLLKINRRKSNWNAPTKYQKTSKIVKNRQKSSKNIKIHQNIGEKIGIFKNTEIFLVFFKNFRERCKIY